MEQIELEQRLDRQARRFIAAVDYYGGEATTTEIRTRTGLSRSKTHSRYDVLADCGLIDITQAESGRGDREPPKIAHLTGKARRAIERGILNGIDTDCSSDEINDIESELRDLQEQYQCFESRLNALLETVEKQDECLEEEWQEYTESAIQGLCDALKANEIDPDPYIRDRF